MKRHTLLKQDALLILNGDRMLDRSVLFTDCAGCGGLHSGKRHPICCVAMFAMQHPAQQRIRQLFLTEIPFYKFDCRKCSSSFSKRPYTFFCDAYYKIRRMPDKQTAAHYSANIFFLHQRPIKVYLVQFYAW